MITSVYLYSAGIYKRPLRRLNWISSLRQTDTSFTLFHLQFDLSIREGGYFRPGTKWDFNGSYTVMWEESQQRKWYDDRSAGLFRTWLDRWHWDYSSPTLSFPLQDVHTASRELWICRVKRWFESVKGWDWDDTRLSVQYHRRQYSVQWRVSVWVCLIYSSAVWDICVSYRLRTWCTNWYCSHVWIIPPLRRNTQKVHEFRHELR